MNSVTDAQRRAWMAQWQLAAVALEKVRVSELQSADLAGIAAALEDASVAAARERGRSFTSGLIAQQAALHRRRST
ncbi:MAG: hypothetical protein U0974_12100 [Gemmatimonadales bacterium]|nr:hypothetical protein [Gemmatimonadales bacterium]MDZ4390457.1 hypothetical protein [Gemmatimonadales bacterium]